jgi:hypothetical protein
MDGGRTTSKHAFGKSGGGDGVTGCANKSSAVSGSRSWCSDRGVFIGGRLPTASPKLDLGERERSLRAEQPHPAGGQAEHRRIQGAGDHRASASQSAISGCCRTKSTRLIPERSTGRSPALCCRRPVSYLHERRSQTRVAAGERTEGDRHRGLHPCRYGANAAVQLAQRVCLNAAGQSRAAAGQRQPCVLRPRAQISRDRFEAGDIAQIDLDRLELQRVQYESDLQTADVNLRTAKIQLLTLLNDRTPIEQFDVIGRSISATSCRRR